MKCRAIVVEAIGRASVREVEIPSPQDGEMLVETHFSCISPGTELRVFAGKEQGSTNHPFVPGYALVGRISESAGSAGPEAGQRVFCSGTQRLSGAGRLWGGHISHAVVSAKDAVLVPENVRSEDAVLAALGAIAHHGVRTSSARAGETAAVVGLGALGQLSSRILKAKGVLVHACDLSEARVATAKIAGVSAVCSAPGIGKSMKALLPGGADLVFDVTGARAVIPDAMGLTRELPWTDEEIPGSRYVIQGSYAGDFSIPYTEAFFRELSFLIPRNCQKQDKESFIGMLSDGSVSAAGLIGEFRSPERIQECYEDLGSPGCEALTYAIRWS